MRAISDCMSAHMSDRQKVIWKVDSEDFKTHSKSKVLSSCAQLRSILRGVESLGSEARDGR